ASVTGSCTLTPTAVGTSNLVATYSGDSHYGGSFSDPPTPHTVTSISTSLTVSPASGTYGGNTNAALTATLASGGSGLTINFYLNGAPAGSALTDGSGVATLSSPSSLTGINAGSYGSAGAPSSCTGVQGVCAAFGGDPSHTASSASNTLTVTK